MEASVNSSEEKSRILQKNPPMGGHGWLKTRWALVLGLASIVPVIISSELRFRAGKIDTGALAEGIRQDLVEDLGKAVGSPTTTDHQKETYDYLQATLEMNPDRMRSIIKGLIERNLDKQKGSSSYHR